MKKFLSIAFLFLYLTASVGITLTLHYCGGSIASLSLSQSSSCCCEEDMKGKKEGCCKDELKYFKITDVQNKAEFSKTKLSFSDIDLQNEKVIYFENKKQYPLLSLAPLQLPRPPDRAQIIPPYKLNHSFLFYS